MHTDYWTESAECECDGCGKIINVKFHNMTGDKWHCKPDAWEDVTCGCGTTTNGDKVKMWLECEGCQKRVETKDSGGEICGCPEPPPKQYGY